MSPRPDPTTSAVAARLTSLFGSGASPGGWVPSQPPLTAEEPTPSCPDSLPGSGGQVAEPAPEVAALPVSPPPTDPEVHAPERTVRGALVAGRLDPGRRGALALGVVGLVAALVAAAVVVRGRPSERPLVVPPVAGVLSATSGPLVVVDVAGRVRRPGLVRLPMGSRVDDALRAAGGVLPGTPTGLLNRARKLVDGEQVVVGLAGAAPGGGVAAGGLLDLNTATAEDFDGLPGIGPVLAERIVSWRTEHGRFASVDQLREVSGIGESKYQTMKGKVTV